MGTLEPPAPHPLQRNPCPCRCWWVSAKSCFKNRLYFNFDSSTQEEALVHWRGFLSLCRNPQKKIITIISQQQSRNLKVLLPHFLFLFKSLYRCLSIIGANGWFPLQMLCFILLTQRFQERENLPSGGPFRPMLTWKLFRWGIWFFFPFSFFNFLSIVLCNGHGLLYDNLHFL